MSTRILSGIYWILNTISGKVYVGSAVSIAQRFRQHRHRLRQGAHRSRHLQSAWNKHGEDAFAFSCLEVVDCKELLVEREQAWIDLLGAADRDKGYNVRPKAKSNLGLRVTAETKAKIAARLLGRKPTEATLAKRRGWRHTEEAKARISAAFKGRVFTDEAKAMLYATRIGRKMTDEDRAKRSVAQKGRTFSDEHRTKLSLAKKGRTLSYAHRAKISAAGMGRTPSNETRAKLSLAWVARRARSSITKP